MTNIHRGWYEINSVILTVLQTIFFSWYGASGSALILTYIYLTSLMVVVCSALSSKTAANITTTPFPSSPSISSRSRPFVLRLLRYVMLHSSVVFVFRLDSFMWNKSEVHVLYEHKVFAPTHGSIIFYQSLSLMVYGVICCTSNTLWWSLLLVRTLRIKILVLCLCELTGWYKSSWLFK